MSIILKREEIKKQNMIATPEELIATKIPKSVKDVIEEYDSKYISESKNNVVYAVLAKDLYDEKGRSNIEFFENLAKDLKEFFPNASFYIIDEEKILQFFAEEKKKMLI